MEALQVLGLECSGVISEVGAGSSWQVGDRVCALLAGGGMAEEVVVDARHVLPVPEGVSLVEAAGLPEVYSTAWLNLFQLAGLKPGEKVLLHAGASGVGSAAIQLCKAFGSPCWVSVGSADRLAYCEALGAQGGVVLAKRVQVLGSTLRSRDDQFKADLFSDLSQHVWPLFAEGRLSPQLARTFPIKDAEAAFAELATNRISGKLVLVIDESLT
eukprot:gene532-799_t